MFKDRQTQSVVQSVLYQLTVKHHKTEEASHAQRFCTVRCAGQAESDRVEELSDLERWGFGDGRSG